ncbi:antitoxin [Candidatus Micrarchaeota archaeon CG1_02_55_22]|nr:MAG: antitoxin [Candidatus Micrarchaeota archaeon CG1_02_55_22]
MVKAMVNISEDANRILNVVKAKEGLKDKSQAIDFVVREYAQSILEPEYRPEFVDEMKRIEKEKRFKVKDVDAYFGLK